MWNTVWAVTLRLAALALGMFLTYCEVAGTYEFFMKDQGSFNYLVKAACAIAVGTALLPVFASASWRAGHRVRSLGLWLLFPVAMTVVFASAIQRTGSATDSAQDRREREQREMILADRSVSDAQQARDLALSIKQTECASGNGIKCRDASATFERAEEKLNAARMAAMTAPVAEKDPLASRLALLFPIVTEEQVRLYQPLVVPLLMSLFAGIFLSLGVHMEPSHRPTTEKTSPPVAEPVIETVTPVPVEPVTTTQIAVMPMPKPRLVAESDQPPALPLYDWVLERLERSAGEHVEFEALYWDYVDTSRKLGRRALTPEEFAPVLSKFSGECGIEIRRNRGQVYLQGVRIVSDHAPEIAQG